MTIFTVRVTRTYTERVTEYVDVEVIGDADDGYAAPRLAKDLVEAHMACCHDLPWQEVKVEQISKHTEIYQSELKDSPAHDVAPIMQPPAPTSVPTDYKDIF